MANLDDSTTEESFRAQAAIVQNLLRNDPIGFLAAEIRMAAADLKRVRISGQRFSVVRRADIGRAADKVIEAFSELWPEYQHKLGRAKQKIEGTLLAIRPRGRPPESRSDREARPSFDDAFAELLSEIRIAEVSGGAVRKRLARRSPR